MENSLDQVNRDNQAWKDRHDVEKAFEEWSYEAAFKNKLEESFMEVFFEKDMKAFATFFAERVKGAPVAVKPVVQARRCDHCGYAYYPQHSEAEKNEYFCCVACENGY